MMKTALLTLSCILSLSQLPSKAQQVPERPVIVHDAPASVVAGQALRIVARVSSKDEIESVNIYISQSGGAAPTQLPLTSAGAGAYSVQVPPAQFAGADSFRYYLDAKTLPGAISETNWMTVQVIGAGSGGGSVQKDSNWKRPALIGGGVLVAVGAGVAIADGGGDDGDGGGGNGGGGGGNPADNVIVRTTSDQANNENVLLPRARIVETGGELGDRNITRVRVQLEFNSIDSGTDSYSVSYNGSTIISGQTSTGASEQVDVVGGQDTQVLIQVTDSVPADGTQSFSYTATVTYFVE